MDKMLNITDEKKKKKLPTLKKKSKLILTKIISRQSSE